VSYGYPPQDPYGQPYGPPAGGYGPYGGYEPYGPYGHPRPASNGSAVAALVCNILLIFCCMPLSIPGIVLSALALGKINHEPDSARKLTIWAWICFGIGVLAAAAVLALVFTNGESDDSGSYLRA
jgi:hypothetical protein